MYILWKYFALGFSALLPLVNPLGSALIFLGLVGHALRREAVARDAGARFVNAALGVAPATEAPSDVPVNG